MDRLKLQRCLIYSRFKSYPEWYKDKSEFQELLLKSLVTRNVEQRLKDNVSGASACIL